ncbi:Uncharacterized protein FKW44_025101, partial [Caligus rogercresseyi]
HSIPVLINCGLELGDVGMANIAGLPLNVPPKKCSPGVGIGRVRGPFGFFHVIQRALQRWRWVSFILSVK